jgi:hypothetical protein
MGALSFLTGGAATPQEVIASLARLEPPFEIDRFGLSFSQGAAAHGPDTLLTFRFSFREIPFEGRARRRDGQPALSLIGDLGYLPFTIENARRRRRMRTILEQAQRGSGLRWEISSRNQIRVSGEIVMGLPLTPTAMLAGVTTLLLRSRPYLELAVSIGGEG